MSRTNPRKIIWAVDAFEAGGKTQKQLAEVLVRLATQRPSRVEPVYILSPEQLQLGSECSLPWLEQYRPAAESALGEVVSRFPIPGLVPPTVLLQNFSSTSSAVERLARYAEQTRADMLVVGTHARRGMPRFFVGSFAESLLFQSKVPVLVVNPGLRPVSSLDRIFFPTDLSRGSRALFRRVLALARDWNAKLTIYHVVPNPVRAVLDSGVYLLGAGWVPAPAYVEDEVESRTRSAHHWLGIAEKAGVSAELLVETAQGGVVASILAAAEKRKASIIAMAAQRGPVASAVIGSVTRQVVREAPCPVWVLHARATVRKT